MDIREKAKIVALVKTLGSTLSTQEILEKYSKYYGDAIQELENSLPPNTVEIGDKSKLFNR